MRFKIHGNSDLSSSLSCILQFTEFETENDFDWLRIYEGWEAIRSQQLLEWSGNEVPPVVKSATNKVLVTFSSDFDDQHKGFNVKWTASKTVSKPFDLQASKFWSELRLL